MRYFDKYAIIVSIPPNSTNNEVIIAGPKYQFTSQQQIWRLLWAHGHYIPPVIPNPPSLNLTWLQVTVNPAQPGASNQQIYLQSNSGEIQIFNQGNETWSYRVTESRGGIELRADDMPNLGGIQTFQQPGSTVFSIELNFHFYVDNGNATAENFEVVGDVMAEIVDLTSLAG